MILLGIVNLLVYCLFKMRSRDPREYLGSRLVEVLDAISSDLFGYKNDLDALLDTIRNRNDYYILGADFASYCEA